VSCRTITALRLDGNFLTAIPLRCKCWDCPDCGPWRQTKLIAEILSGAPSTFITLTWRTRNNFTPDQAAKLMSNKFSDLVEDIRRQWPDIPFEYAAVWEATKTGYPHLHIVARSPYIPQPWLSKRWAKLTGSYIVDIRTIRDSRTAAKYVSKYIAKSPHHFQNIRRYRFSKHYKPDPSDIPIGMGKPESGWLFVNIPLPQVVPALRTITTSSDQITSSDIYTGVINDSYITILDGVEMNSQEKLSRIIDYLRKALNTPLDVSFQHTLHSGAHRPGPDPHPPIHPLPTHNPHSIVR